MKTNNLLFTLSVAATLPAIANRTPKTTAERDKPNVVLILMDDLGYGDVGYTGAPDIRTPNIDRIAYEGRQYSCYYAAAPTSTPTRCALMSGRYPARFRDMEEAFHVGVDHIGFPSGEEILPRAMKRNGYKTGMVGKWHLGAQPEQRPERMGFDYFEGFMSGNIDYFAHVERAGNPDLFCGDKPVESGEYMTDFIAGRAVRYIRENRHSPFFLYIAFNAPHWPYQGPGDGPCAEDGHDWMSGSREKLVQMIEHTDKCIGEIMVELERHGLDRSTVVIFTSDNGGDKYARNAPFKGYKGSACEGGIRVPLAVRWPGNVPAGDDRDLPVITMDITATILSVTGTPFHAPQDGVSFMPEESREKYYNRTLAWRVGMRDQFAIRRGDWKLYGNKGKVELYNLLPDRSELNDLSALYPEKAKELQRLYDEWEMEMPYKQTLFGPQLRPSSE